MQPQDIAKAIPRGVSQARIGEAQTSLISQLWFRSVSRVFRLELRRARLLAGLRVAIDFDFTDNGLIRWACRVICSLVGEQRLAATMDT